MIRRWQELRLDPLAVAALFTLPLVLIAQEYCGDQPYYRGLFPDGSELGALAWWAGARVIGYGLVPLAVALAFRANLVELGLGLGETARHFRAYLFLYLAVVPVVFVASRAPAFRQVYPFYRGPHQLMWELGYGVTFVVLEWFFRGFLLLSLRRVMGSYSVLVAMVPYVMVHFGKPLPEVLGAVIAGVALGTMTLITRSIWGGVMVHLGVAWLMDLLALV